MIVIILLFSKVFFVFSFLFCLFKMCGNVTEIIDLSRSVYIWVCDTGIWIVLTDHTPPTIVDFFSTSFLDISSSIPQTFYIAFVRMMPPPCDRGSTRRSAFVKMISIEESNSEF